VASLDLLLRWAVVRLAEGNTKTLVGVTGMLKALFDLLADQGYRCAVSDVGRLRIAAVAGTTCAVSAAQHTWLHLRLFGVLGLLNGVVSSAGKTVLP
jgi:NAD(P)H-dependent FMN reductase